MKTIQVNRKKISEEKENELLGVFAEEKDYNLLVDENAIVIDETGKILAVLVRGEVDLKSEALPFYAAVHKNISPTQNRGVSSGGLRKYHIRKDGKKSNTTVAPQVNSSIIGFYDRYARTNFCRKTAFNENHPELFATCMPMIKKVDDIFSRHHPERYQVQKEISSKTSKDFVIEGTTFTTVTLNKNFRTAYHRDAGDLPDGFGCLSYVQKGKFTGGYLVYPMYETAFRLRTGDVLLFDPHEIHGNTEIKAFSKDWERITAVYYYRKNMIYCGSHFQELERAKALSGRGNTKEDLNDFEG